MPNNPSSLGNDNSPRGTRRNKRKGDDADHVSPGDAKRRHSTKAGSKSGPGTRSRQRSEPVDRNNSTIKVPKVSTNIKPAKTTTRSTSTIARPIAKPSRRGVPFLRRRAQQLGIMLLPSNRRKRRRRRTQETKRITGSLSVRKRKRSSKST